MTAASESPKGPDYFSLLNAVIDGEARKVSGGIVTVGVGTRDMVLTAQLRDGAILTAYRSRPEAEAWSLPALRATLGFIDADPGCLYGRRCDREALAAHIAHLEAMDEVAAVLEGVRA